MDLKGKIALVTGASRGVGAATAVALGEVGCKVACAARSTRAEPQKTPGTLDETLDRIRAAGAEALAVPTNLAVATDVEQMVERTVAHFGGVDILINNAAITFVGDLDIPLKRHDLIMEVNLRAPLLAMRAAVPHMRKRGGGAIVNLSSAAALSAIPGLMSYGVSKIALERLTVDVANQVQGDGITCNVFRIDIPVASEGFVANTPGVDRSDWEPCEVAAEGILWMVRQPLGYSGVLASMYELRQQHGIMKSRATRSQHGAPPTRLQEGIMARGPSMFA